MFNKETTLPILLTVMCALLLAVVLLYGFNTGRFDFLKSENRKQVSGQTEQEKIKRTDYTEVARKTLDWIDKQRNESDWYILGKMCLKNDCETVVDDKEVGNKDGLIATWVRLNFYEQHKDPIDLEIVKKDIDLFYEKYKDDDLKDALWVCKTAYEIAQSKYIDQSQKEKLKELCVNKEILEIEKVNTYWDDRYEAFADLKPLNKDWNYYRINLRYFDDVFGSVSDLVYKYKWTGDKNYLTMSDKYIESQKDLILHDRGMLFENIQNTCLLGLSVMDRYELAGENKNDLDLVVGWYQELKNNEKTNLLNSPICGLLAKRMLDVTREDVYLDDFESISKALLLNNEREERGTNKEGFVRSDLSKGGFQPHRIVVENSLMVEFLR